jgi:hypothetical protein
VELRKHVKELNIFLINYKAQACVMGFMEILQGFLSTDGSTGVINDLK